MFTRFLVEYQREGIKSQGELDWLTLQPVKLPRSASEGKSAGRNFLNKQKAAHLFLWIYSKIKPGFF